MTYLHNKDYVSLPNVNEVDDYVMWEAIDIKKEDDIILDLSCNIFLYLCFWDVQLKLP